MVAVVVHQIYVGTDGDKQQPFFLSIVLTDSNNQGAPQYKAILWKKTVNTHPPTHATQYTQRKILIFFFLFLNTKKGAQKIYLPHTPGRPLTVKQILRYKTSLFFSFQTCLFDIGFNFLFFVSGTNNNNEKKKKKQFPPYGSTGKGTERGRLAWTSKGALSLFCADVHRSINRDVLFLTKFLFLLCICTFHIHRVCCYWKSRKDR